MTDILAIRLFEDDESSFYSEWNQNILNQLRPEQIFTVGNISGSLKGNIDFQLEQNEIFNSEISSKTIRDNSIWFIAQRIYNEQNESDIQSELNKWFFTILYVLRVFRNENLHATIIQSLNNGNNKFITNQFNLFTEKANIENVLPINSYISIVENLLEFKLNKRFEVILDSFRRATNSSLDISYFFYFSALDGLISYWSETKGLSDLWGVSVSSVEEQNRIHKELRNSILEIINKENSTELSKEQKDQLQEFFNSNFPHPNSRKHRRALKKRFLEYVEKLPQEIKDHSSILTMKSNFNKFSDYRNSLGHTINSAYQDEKFIESLNILATVVTIVLRFELNKINNEKAKCWFVENRELNLKTFILPFDKENFSSLYEDLLLRSVVPKYDKDIVAELRSSHGENYPVEIVFKNYFSFEDGMYNLIFNIELSIENAHKLYKENREARKKIKSDLQSHWRNVDSWKISISGIEMHQKFRYKYIIETIPARRLGWDSSQPSKYNFQISEIIKIECYKENL